MAHTLDEYLEFDTWKAIAEDNFYDWKLVNKVRRSLRTLREKNDARGLLGVLEMCVRNNFGGVESARYVTFVTSETEHGLISFRKAVQRGALRYAETTGMKIDMEHQDLLRDQTLDRMLVTSFVNRTTGC